VILVGNLDRDPRTRSTQDMRIANLAIATSKRRPNRASTGTHRMAPRGDLQRASRREIAEKYLKKGSKIYVGAADRNGIHRDREGHTAGRAAALPGELTMLDGAGGVKLGEDGPGSYGGGGGDEPRAAPPARPSPTPSALDDDIGSDVSAAR
jgi:single-stranded DNA-binding protein